MLHLVSPLGVRRHWRLVVLPLAVALLTLAPAAVAQGGMAPPPSVAQLPDSPIKQELQKVEEKRIAAEQPESLTARPIREALRAVERERGARAATDRIHGGRLHNLARRWVKVASALVRVAVAEADADTIATKLEELRTKQERAEALLAEQQARLGKLQTAVRRAEKVAADKRAAAAAAEAARLKKAAKRKGRR